MATVSSIQYAQTPTGGNQNYQQLKPTELHGRVRCAYARYHTDATTAIVAGDILNLFKLPKGARVLSMEALVLAGFVNSSAKIGIASDDDRYGSAVDLSSVGRKQFLLAPLDADYETTQEELVIMTFVTADPAEDKDIVVICQYVVD